MQKPIHILLVEDDPDDVELLEAALADEQINFESTVIPQGDRVIPYLEVCKKFPNIIILDLNLPKTHGKEILAQLKGSATLSHIPVVILTTSSARQDREFCLNTGANAYMIKPVTMEDFKSVVQRILAVIGQEHV
ncbi:MAG: response regulator [Chitinophagaceae bacterium]|nr:response regulator [Chitinophagaceae bacterium]